MKRLFLVVFAIACVATPAAAQDFWTKLGLSEDDAKGHLWTGAMGPSFSVPLLPALRALPVGARNALMTQASAYALKWVRSEDFRNRYAEYRESNKPRAAEGMGSTAERKKQDRETLEKSIKEIETMAKTLPAEQQPMVKQMLQVQKDQLKAIDDPNNRLYSKETESMFAGLNAAQAAEQEESLKKWGARYPAAPAVMIREKLRAFLTMSETVDFGAALATRPNGKRVFVNPDYEAKPASWKLLFRAGRETTTALRAEAQKWLTELK